MLIITGSDDNYVPGVLVLIASAAFHNPSARFAVLDMGISRANRARIDALAARLGVPVTRHEVADGCFDRLTVKRAHLSRSAYLRLLIPSIFSEEDRAIYMDCDMAVIGKLDLLQDIELGDNLVAAVPCPSPDPEEVAATGHVIGTYVNSGLLVMNLPVWRRERAAEACIELLSDPGCSFFCEDQSAINVLARGRIVHLDEAYNAYCDPAAYDKTASFPLNAVVLHYVVNNKPWNLPIPLDGIWHFHAGRIADLMPPKRKLTMRRRISVWNRDRKQIIGRLMQRAKYRARGRIINAMRQIEGNYLAAARLAQLRDGGRPAA